METKESPKAEIIKEKSSFVKIIDAAILSGFRVGFGLSCFFIVLMILNSILMLPSFYENFYIREFFLYFLMFSLLSCIYWLVLSFILIVIPTTILGNIFHYFQKNVDYKLRRKRILIIGIIFGLLFSISIISIFFPTLKFETLSELNKQSISILVIMVGLIFAGYYNNLIFFNHLYGKNPETMKAQE